MLSVCLFELHKFQDSSSPVSVVAHLGGGVGGGDEQIHHARLQLLQTQEEDRQCFVRPAASRLTELRRRPHLTHLCDGIIEDPPSVVSPLPHQFDLPGPGGQAKV